uniref:Biogenesis of lysosome-related organelles complex 1 subunit 7 n=1 Tax=Canis lupus familiaris TaxID=9615 RepID=A0A8C0P0E5_CANLF
MAAAGSAAVSGAGTPVAGPAGRDLFAEGLLEFLRPAVQQLDSHVHAVRESQVELREQIDNLATELCRINEDQKVALDLDPYVKKLLNARRRVVLVNNILQNAQVNRLPELRKQRESRGSGLRGLARAAPCSPVLARVLDGASLGAQGAPGLPRCSQRPTSCLLGTAEAAKPQRCQRNSPQEGPCWIQDFTPLAPQASNRQEEGTRAALWPALCPPGRPQTSGHGEGSPGGCWKHLYLTRVERDSRSQRIMALSFFQE